MVTKKQVGQRQSMMVSGWLATISKKTVTKSLLNDNCWKVVVRGVIEAVGGKTIDKNWLLKVS